MKDYTMTKTFPRGSKKATAIKIIEDNLDKDFFEVAHLISVALDLNKYAGRAYYKYMIKHGLISKFQPSDTPWKSAKASKATKTVKKAKADFVKKDKPVKDAMNKAADEQVMTTEKPATAMIREFVRKQKMAARKA